MTRKNKLILVVANYNRRNNIGYYYYPEQKTETGEAAGTLFCDGAAMGIAASKAMLHKAPIDEIIAITTDDFAQDAEAPETTTMKLNEGLDLNQTDVSELSDFDYLRYRLLEFMSGDDHEIKHTLNSIPEDRQKAIKEKLDAFFGGEYADSLDRLLEDPDSWAKLLGSLGEVPDAEVHWIKAFLYSRLDRDKKLKPAQCRLDIPITTAPVFVDIDTDMTIMGNIAKMIEVLKKDDSEEVHMYVDVHGFPPEDSYILLSILSALNDDTTNGIFLEEINSIRGIPRAFMHRICEARKRYRVERLLSGVNAFIQYGKMDLIKDYWQKSGEVNEYIDKLIYAMNCIDIGMSLCNIGELENGIRLFRVLLHEEYMPKFDSEEEVLIMALRQGIINDYGPLVTGEDDEIDIFEMVKWAFRKGFYQQTLTIIESRLPEDMLKRGILYPCETEEEKAAYIKAINYHYWDDQAKDRYVFNDPEHYFIKYYGKFMMDYRERNCDHELRYAQVRTAQVFSADRDTAAILPAHSVISNEAQLLEVLYSYYSICAIRNSINHAAKDNDDAAQATDYTEDSQTRIMIREKLQNYINSYQRIIDAIDGNVPEQVAITAKEIKDYTFTHGPKGDPNFNRVRGFLSERDKHARERGEAQFAADLHRPHHDFANKAFSMEDAEITVTKEGDDYIVRFHKRDSRHVEPDDQRTKADDHKMEEK